MLKNSINLINNNKKNKIKMSNKMGLILDLIKKKIKKIKDKEKIQIIIIMSGIWKAKIVKKMNGDLKKVRMRMKMIIIIKMMNFNGISKIDLLNSLLIKNISGLLVIFIVRLKIIKIKKKILKQIIIRIIGDLKIIMIIIIKNKLLMNGDSIIIQILILIIIITKMELMNGGLIIIIIKNNNKKKILNKIMILIGINFNKKKNNNNKFKNNNKTNNNK